MALPRLVSLRGHTLLDQFAGCNPIFLDLGAHKGEFAEAVTRRFGGVSFAVEANPDLHAAIVQTRQVTAIHAAAVSTEGPVRLTIARNLEASSVMGRTAFNEVLKNVEVPGQTLEILLGATGTKRADVLKLDIEGAEIAILTGADPELLSRFDQITVEFHDFCGIVDRSSVKATMQRLEELGFFMLCLSLKSNKDVLFINLRQHHLNPLERLWLRSVARLEVLIRKWCNILYLRLLRI